MNAGNARQLGFEVRNGAQIGVVLIEIAERSSQQGEQFRLVMIALGANLDQLDEVSCRLGA